MKLFSIDDNKKFNPIDEVNFKSIFSEKDLEDMIELNPEYFFDNESILIIGRQVTTNLNTVIDLLGIDNQGNTVVIELKKNKTPRETIAQILEYASFVEKLDYNDLNSIFQNYNSNDIEVALQDQLNEIFPGTNFSSTFLNDCTRLVIIASEISKEIKQTSEYLRSKGLNVFCIEFKYFKSNDGKTNLITSDVVVGNDEYIKTNIKSGARTGKIINKSEFLSYLDEYGNEAFEKLINYCEKNNFIIKWGTKGFSINVKIDNQFISFAEGYSNESDFSQSLYFYFGSIIKKSNNSEEIINQYKDLLNKINFSDFIITNTYYKIIINSFLSSDLLINNLNILKVIGDKIIQNGYKNF